MNKAILDSLRVISDTTLNLPYDPVTWNSSLIVETEFPATIRELDPGTDSFGKSLFTIQADGQHMERYLQAWRLYGLKKTYPNVTIELVGDTLVVCGLSVGVLFKHSFLYLFTRESAPSISLNQNHGEDRYQDGERWFQLRYARPYCLSNTFPKSYLLITEENQAVIRTAMLGDTVIEIKNTQKYLSVRYELMGKAEVGQYLQSLCCGNSYTSGVQIIPEVKDARTILHLIVPNHLDAEKIPVHPVFRTLAFYASYRNAESFSELYDIVAFILFRIIELIYRACDDPFSQVSLPLCSRSDFEDESIIL